MFGLQSPCVPGQKLEQTIFPVIRDINAFKGLSPKDGPPHCLTDHVENSDWCLFGFAFPLLNVKNWGFSLHVFVYNVPPYVLSHFSHVRLFVALWIAAFRAPLSVGFSRQEYWSGLPCPPSGDLLDPGNEPAAPVPPAFQVDSLPLIHQGSPISPYTFPYISFPAFLHITSHSSQVRYLRCDFSFSKADNHFGGERMVAYCSTKIHNTPPQKKKKILQKRVNSKLTSRK